MMDGYQLVLPLLLFGFEVSFEVKAAFEDESKKLINPSANKSNSFFNQIVLLLIECIVVVIFDDLFSVKSKI